jgi:alkylhydroperoxidase family enzyme
MARIEPLPVRQWPPEMAEALKAMTLPSPRHPVSSGQDRPKGGNVLGALAHHPALARAFFTFNGHLLRATTLTERQRELLILRTAAVRKSSYEWAQHLFLAHDAGLSDDEIAWIAWGPDGPFWNDLEAALLRAVDELIDDGVIAQATWVKLNESLDTQQILDVIFTVGAYETLAWMMESFGIGLDDDLRASLRPQSGTASDDA